MAYTTINKSTDYFNTKLYTGNGATSSAGTLARTITGVGFEPSLTWVKERTSVTGGYTSHSLHDAVRTAPMTIESNSTSAEQNVTTQYGNGGIGSFTSDGFGIHSGHAGNSDNFNVNSGNYVSWNWKANGAGSSNTNGSITSTVSANTTSGFSIVSYTGTGSNATVGHGLGSAPKMVICKNRSSAVGWSSWHTGIGDGTKYILLNTTQSTLTASNIWNSTIPTSSVISVGSHPSTNESGSNMIAYCFAEKKGFSKFGSYTGNGNADGTFVYTGFKPAWVMIKSSTDTTNWTIMDNKRDIFNPKTKWLYPNVNDAEAIPGIEFDFLSNGFKSRTTGSYVNASGSTYIYMAFAEAPLVGTNGVTAKAR